MVRPLRGRHHDVRAPLVHAHLDPAGAADGIDHQQRLAVAQYGADRLEIRNDAGRALIVNDDDSAIGLGLDARRDHGGVGHFAPRNLQPVELHRQALGDRRETLAELPVLDHQHGIAGGQHIDERGFHAAGAGGAKQEDVMLCAHEAAQGVRHLIEDDAKFRPAMRQDRQRGRGAYAFRNGGRSGHPQAIVGRNGVGGHR